MLLFFGEICVFFEVFVFFCKFVIKMKSWMNKIINMEFIWSVSLMNVLNGYEILVEFCFVIKVEWEKDVIKI